MSADERPIEVSDRFEDKDSRNAGRIVEVREVKSPRRILVQVEVHPNNPSAVGRHTWLQASTIHAKYRRVSR